MLSAEAYSFQLKSRLAISLSWVAGYTNVVTLAVTTHVVSHMTGNTTMFGNSLGAGQWEGVRFFGFLIGVFLIGAVASALMTEGAKRRGMRSKYVIPIALEAVLLTAFALGVDQTRLAGSGGLRSQYLLCGLTTCAMGLQNATITKISGAVVRTTHLTGVVTDLGLEGVQFALWYWDQIRSRHRSRLSRALRVTRRHPSFMRLVLLASIAGSFVFGAVVGTAVWMRWPTLAMVPPVGFLLWIILQDRRHPIADVKELDLVSDPELRMHGIVKSLLPGELGIYRMTFHADGPFRAPNFSQWAERLPRHWRVVILAVSPLIQFDRESSLNLRVAVEHLRRKKRVLILAGITQAQYRVLEEEGVVQVIDEANLCTDLEFAIARGLDAVHAVSAGAPTVQMAG
jgi:uncharacterized membrane protein YoaK (UPF0700 family)